MSNDEDCCCMATAFSFPAVAGTPEGVFNWSIARLHMARPVKRRHTTGLMKQIVQVDRLVGHKAVISFNWPTFWWEIWNRFQSWRRRASKQAGRQALGALWISRSIKRWIDRYRCGYEIILIVDVWQVSHLGRKKESRKRPKEQLNSFQTSPREI